MQSQLRYVSRILFLMMALGLAQCSKKTKSQDVHITVAPAQPIVFTSDFTTTQGGSPITIKGPWFSFGVSIDNESDTAITVIALHIEVTGYDANNSPQTVTADFVPATDNIATSNITCNYGDFGQFDAKGVNKGPLNETPSGSPNCPSGGVHFFSSGNPKPASTSFIRYTVKVKPIGYFGARGAPTDRFDSFATVYTQ
jgi:hypothetical protein